MLLCLSVYLSPFLSLIFLSSVKQLIAKSRKPKVSRQGQPASRKKQSRNTAYCSTVEQVVSEQTLILFIQVILPFERRTAS